MEGIYYKQIIVSKLTPFETRLKKLDMMTRRNLLGLLGLLGFTKVSFAQTSNDLGPERLVIIKGKAIITNHPELGVTPATSETLIFQKVGCESCFVGTHTDIYGNYTITVGDGKYKIIVRNPSSPEFDMLLPEQARFVDTETLEAKQYSKQIFNFDIKIRVPE